MSLLLEAPIRVTATNLRELVIRAVTQSTFYQKANPLTKTAVKGNYDFEDVDVDAVLTSFEDGTEDRDDSTESTFKYKQRNGKVCGFRMWSKIPHARFINTMQEQGYAPGVHAELITQTEAWPAFEALFIRIGRKKWSKVALYGDVTYGSGDNSLCDGLFVKFVARMAEAEVLAANPDGIVTADEDAIDNVDPFDGNPNVADEMQKVVDAMPDDSAFEGEPMEGEPVLFVSSRIWRKYMAYQKKANTRGGNTANVTERGAQQFDGYEVRVLTDLKPYEMYFTHESNIMVIFDSETDMTSVSLVDMYEINRKKLLDMDCMWRGAVDVRDARRLVYYSNS